VALYLSEIVGEKLLFLNVVKHHYPVPGWSRRRLIEDNGVDFKAPPLKHLLQVLALAGAAIEQEGLFLALNRYPGGSLIVEEEAI
jgi:hypothetical protein